MEKTNIRPGRNPVTYSSIFTLISSKDMRTEGGLIFLHQKGAAERAPKNIVAILERVQPGSVNIQLIISSLLNSTPIIGIR